jgi:hypothetical protein
MFAVILLPFDVNILLFLIFKIFAIFFSKIIIIYKISKKFFFKCTQILKSQSKKFREHFRNLILPEIPTDFSGELTQGEGVPLPLPLPLPLLLAAGVGGQEGVAGPPHPLPQPAEGGGCCAAQSGRGGRGRRGRSTEVVLFGAAQVPHLATAPAYRSYCQICCGLNT